MSLYDSAKRHLSPIESARNRIAELELENAELRKDVERYRSLRWMAMQDEEMQERCKKAMESVTPDYLTPLTPEMWDAAIDTIAAIASEKGNERGPK